MLEVARYTDGTRVEEGDEVQDEEGHTFTVDMVMDGVVGMYDDGCSQTVEWVPEEWRKQVRES